ncbi:MAG: nitrate reductase molybdenum cofactor assembly chaperone, partial [Planctomycetota bacterium]|nr:nitrate reductase molybdenum cofactor assembly chaperone [Planctomycetota bacterium]
MDGKTYRAFSRLLSYPDDQTGEAAELLYIVLKDVLSESAKDVASFGAFLEQHDNWQIEEAFTSTFDINPPCALEIGYHLFGEDYTRGLFLVRMREELRRYGLDESAELPDHITHVLAVIAAMSAEEADRFVPACVLPAIEKMQTALAKQDTPYRHVINALSAVLNHMWSTTESSSEQLGGSSFSHDAIPAGVDLLHAFPVA